MQDWSLSLSDHACCNKIVPIRMDLKSMLIPDTHPVIIAVIMSQFNERTLFQRTCGLIQDRQTGVVEVGG